VNASVSAIPRHLRAYWATFLQSSQAGVGSERQFYESFRVGADADDANEGAALILSGEKTATSSLLLEFERSAKPLPTPGCLSVLEDGRGEPVCVVRTTAVAIIPFHEVDAEFAHDYGESDRSLEGWRKTFWRYYSRACVQHGLEMSPDTLLVCERFQVIHK
jgi:uncharacterized protein YhfF